MNDLKRKLIPTKRRLEKLSIPDFDADIYLRRMNGLEREDFISAQAKAQLDEKDKGIAAFLPLQAKIVLMTACDEEGEQIFDSIMEVQKMDGLLLEQISFKALEVNGLTKASREAIEKKAFAMTGSGTS